MTITPKEVGLGILAAGLVLLAPIMVVADEPRQTDDAIVQERVEAEPLPGESKPPVGLLWEDELAPFEDEIIIKDGLIYT